MKQTTKLCMNTTLLFFLTAAFPVERSINASDLLIGGIGGSVLSQTLENEEETTNDVILYASNTPSDIRTLSYDTSINDCEGDVNFDQLVGEGDLKLLSGDFGQTGCGYGYPCIADIDRDGDVDGTDLFKLASLYGSDCTTYDRVCNAALYYDTGYPGWHYAVNENYGIAVRFSPPAYPWTFNLARFWPWSASEALNFEVHVWDDDGPGGMPGSDLVLPVARTASITDGWEDVPLPEITVTEGDFYIGWIQRSDNRFYNGGEEASSYNGRSYIMRPDGSWSNFADIGSYVNMMIRQSCRSSPPVLSNLRLSQSILPVPVGSEFFRVNLYFDFQDLDGDLNEVVITISDPSGTSQGGSENLQTHQITGSSETDIWVDSSFQPGVYRVDLVLVDEFGNSSEPQSVTFTVQEDAERPLEIASLSLSVGSIGDTVEISGSGFNDEDPSANEVYFGDSLQRAQIVSATDTLLVVLVPEGGLSGPVRVKTPDGETQSIDSFTVEPTITITPDIESILTGETVQFSCTRSGVDSSGVQWLVNGQTVPDPGLGVMEPSGLYTAPENVPSTNPITIRCEDAEYPQYYSEVAVQICNPVPRPGGGTVLAQAGGEIESANGEVTLDIPANALSSDTLVTLEVLKPELQPVIDEDADTLCAVSLGPSDLAFSQPVDITFTLKSWTPPGTQIPLILIEDAGAPSDTGKTATVDLTGLKATAQIEHFSTYLLQKRLALPRAPIAERWDGLAAIFPEYELQIPPGLSFVEGLAVPLLIKRHAGKGEGPGPFLPGVNAVAVLTGTTRDTTPLKVELIQPSADGWQLGLILRIPTLPQFGEGSSAGATLYVDYPTQAGGAGQETMTFTFTIECLNELIFDYVQPPLLPNGAIHYVSQGSRTVELPQKASYRFSEVHIGPQGILKVAEAWSLVGDPRVPLSIVVTGDVTVEGKIIACGTDGEDGQNGSGSDDGGYGGKGGNLAAGAGGIGGPTSPTVYDRDGRDALYAPYGGKGGLHGYKWDNASWVSVLIAGAKIWCSFGTLASAPASLSGYSSFVQDFYGGVQETVKYNNKDENRVRSAGEGGKAGPTYNTADYSTFYHYWTFEPYFPAPVAGGGGGGSGKMRISGEPDAAGAGGGGGGGAAPNVRIIACGRIFFARGALFDGHGGAGGRGGNGSWHSWSNQAAPGGGGAGGNGANLLLAAAGGLINNGSLQANRGRGALGGEIDEDEGIILLPKTFGEFGKSGHLRLDGRLSGNTPSFMGFFRGAHMGQKVVSSDGRGYTSTYFEDTIYLGTAASGLSLVLVDGVEAAQVGGSENRTIALTLTEGLHTLSVKKAIHGEAGLYADPHPWMNQWVFSFPGLEDRDQDGLTDGMEDHVNTNKLDPDSDDDGLNDADEVLIYRTDPNSSDSDQDGYSDPDELYAGTDPMDENDHPGIDTDDDGLPDGWEIKHFGSLEQSSEGDPDEDDLSNADEFTYRTDPNTLDTDDDGVSDGAEVLFESDPLNGLSSPEGPHYNDTSCDGVDNDLDGEVDEFFVNTDNDGQKDCVDPDDDNDSLSDDEEVQLGTDPLDWDSDDDNLSDFTEVRSTGTNPLLADTDEDGLIDGDEISLHGTLPLDPDSDDDGILDGEEVNVHGTDPLKVDSDDDGITDYDEIHVYETDPLKMDTDGDGYDDLVEIDAGTDPKNPEDYPGSGDIDGDGLPDQWELDHFGDLHQGPHDDTDHDFLDNEAELLYETNPALADTDGDGAWDNVEIDQGSDPNNLDSMPEVCDGLDNDGDGQTDEDVCETHLDNKGLEFFLAFMPTLDDSISLRQCYLYITTDLPAEVKVEYPVGNIFGTYTVTRSAPKTVNLPGDAATVWSGGVQNNAVRVTATNEVAVVMRNAASYEPDQALALPVEALGNEYIVMSYDPSNQYDNSEFAVVATQDGTVVNIDPVHLTYDPYNITLNRGEGALVTFTRYPVKRTIVTSNKPIALSNGNRCTSVPEYTRYCQHLFEMAVPVNGWGTEILALNHPESCGDFRKTYYHVFAAQDNTQLTFNGEPYGSLNRSQYTEIVRSGADYANHFSADKPIFVVQYMNSTCDEYPYSDACNSNEWPTQCETGDASMTNLVPTSHFPRSYVFYAASYTRLIIVAHTEDVQSGRMLLDEKPVDPNLFEPFPTAPQYSHGVVEINLNGLRTSRSVHGHAITMVYPGYNSAFTNPLGVKFQE